MNFIKKLFLTFLYISGEFILTAGSAYLGFVLGYLIIKASDNGLNIPEIFIFPLQFFTIFIIVYYKQVLEEIKHYSTIPWTFTAAVRGEFPEHVKTPKIISTVIIFIIAFIIHFIVPAIILIYPILVNIPTETCQ